MLKVWSETFHPVGRRDEPFTGRAALGYDHKASGERAYKSGTTLPASDGLGRRRKTTKVENATRRGGGGAHAGFSQCRAILVRYEKKASNYLGLIKVACILLCYRRRYRLFLLR